MCPDRSNPCRHKKAIPCGMALRALLGVQASGDVVLDPLGIQPLQRGDFHATDQYAEVQVIAEGQTGAPRLGDDGAFLDHIAHLDVDLAQMGVEGHESQAVVDDDEVAVNAELTGEDHAAVIGCGDFGIADRGQVKTQMVGFAHLLAR